MAPVMARCGRVKGTPDESCRIRAFEFYRAIKLAFLLPLISPIVYAQPAPPVQQLVFRPYHASGLYEVGDTSAGLFLQVPQRRRMHINGPSGATTKKSSKKASSI